MHIKFLNPTLASRDGDLLMKIGKDVLSNEQLQERLTRDSNKRFPPASD